MALCNVHTKQNTICFKYKEKLKLPSSSRRAATKRIARCDSRFAVTVKTDGPVEPHAAMSPGDCSPQPRAFSSLSCPVTQFKSSSNVYLPHFHFFKPSPRFFLHWSHKRKKGRKRYVTFSYEMNIAIILTDVDDRLHQL